MSEHTSGDRVWNAVDVSTASDLDEGTTYRGEVDRFAGSNAIIALPAGHINLGPIERAAEGELVEFEFVSGQWGKCLNEEYVSAGYKPRNGASHSRSKSVPESKRKSGNGDPKSDRMKGAGSRFNTDNSEQDLTPYDPDNKNKLLNGNM